MYICISKEAYWDVHMYIKRGLLRYQKRPIEMSSYAAWGIRKCLFWYTYVPLLIYIFACFDIHMCLFWYTYTYPCASLIYVYILLICIRRSHLTLRAAIAAHKHTSQLRCTYIKTYTYVNCLNRPLLIYKSFVHT